MAEERSIDEGTIKSLRDQRVSLHSFPGQFYFMNIYPYKNILSPQEFERINTLLNDFRDIIDPGQYIPFCFTPKSTGEIMERERMSEEGRVIH